MLWPLVMDCQQPAPSGLWAHWSTKRSNDTSSIPGVHFGTRRWRLDEEERPSIFSSRISLTDRGTCRPVHQFTIPILLSLWLFHSFCLRQALAWSWHDAPDKRSCGQLLIYSHFVPSIHTYASSASQWMQIEKSILRNNTLIPWSTVASYMSGMRLLKQAQICVRAQTHTRAICGLGMWGSEQEPLWTALPGSHTDWGPFAPLIWLEPEHRRQPTSSPCDVSTCVLWPSAWMSRFHTEGGREDESVVRMSQPFAAQQNRKWDWTWLEHEK